MTSTITRDRDELTSLETTQEDATNVSGFSRVPCPPDQALKKDRRRCASAVAGRRGKGPGLTNPGRPASSELHVMMGTRLEPQGADGCDPPVPVELQENNNRKNNVDDNSSHGLVEVGEVEMMEKDESSHDVIPCTSSELEENSMPSSILDATRQDSDHHHDDDDGGDGSQIASEDQELEVPPRTPVGPQMRSSRDLVDIIKSESTSQPVNLTGLDNSNNSE